MQAIARANRVNEGKNNGLIVDYCGILKRIKRIKQVAVELLKTLKAGKLRVNQWRDKEATRDAVRVAIRDFRWSDDTGLPADDYSEAEVGTKTDDVFRHVFRVYPTVPSPYYENAA